MTSSKKIIMVFHEENQGIPLTDPCLED